MHLEISLFSRIHSITKILFIILNLKHNSEIYIIVRSGDEYVLKYSDKLGIFEGMSELKRFWNNNIFQLPMIPFQGEKKNC